MKERRWITREEALAVHDMMMAQHGGLAGVRDIGLLESALARPRNLQAHGQHSLARLAAAYASGIVRNHPFADGNKRTGFLIAATFLEINGLTFVAPETEVVLSTVAPAGNTLTDDAYAEWLGANVDLRED